MKVKQTLSLFMLCISILLVGAVEAQAQVLTAEEFVRNASIGNEFEVVSGKAALSKSRNEGVRKFAQHMVNDHTEMTNQLKTVLTTASVDQAAIRSTLDASHQKLLDDVNRLSGADFDRQYLEVQKNAHKETITLFEGYAADGTNVALRNFASERLPLLKEHEQQLEQIKL